MSRVKRLALQFAAQLVVGMIIVAVNGNKSRCV